MAKPVEAEEGDEAAQHPHGVVRYLKALGPGMISGASDNDPTTVATVSVIGSTTVYRLSWLLILLYPMLTAIQIISARIGTVTKRGLQRDVAKQYGRSWGLVLLISVLAVNLLTIAADLGGGAAALGLIFHACKNRFRSGQCGRKSRDTSDTAAAAVVDRPSRTTGRKDVTADGTQRNSRDGQTG